MLPLTGVLVVACEQAVAAPLATRHLADLGARVVKVERPGAGDFARDYDRAVHGLSSHFVWLNRGKESVALDLKRADHLAVVLALVERADVFVQNLAPGAAERLGLGADTLRARFPRLVTCSVSGYGGDGPYRDAKAYDALVQAEAGVVAVTGTPDEPAKAGIPVADIGAGMYAFSGILAALYERERTGRGSAVEASLFDSLVEWMGYPLLYARHGGTAPVRAGTSHAAIAPYGVFTTADGVRVVLSVQSEREWESFCRSVLRDPSVAADPRFAGVAARVANRPALDGLVAAAFAALDVTEAERRLAEGRIAHARERDVDAVISHPQLVDRDRWVQVNTPGGPADVVRPALGLPGRDLACGPVPAVGEHTAAVVAELGLPPLLP